MDDGPGYIAASIDMLAMWKAQHVDRIIATPHYHPHRESVENFLTRRNTAFGLLSSGNAVPQILLGAEIRIEKGISEFEKMDLLTLAGSQYILLEFPYAPYKEWMLTEVCNLVYRFHLILVLAHMERYINWYSKEDMERVLSLPEAILQINCEAMLKRKTLKFALELITADYPVLFGSDAHNTTDRPPNIEMAYRTLQSKLSKTDFAAFLELNEKLIPVN
jgi:protein-tyrosine phosphatase